MRKYALPSAFLATVLFFSAFFALRPIVYSSDFSSSETLLGAGAKWAANGGTKAAYVDFYDNVLVHPNPNLDLSDAWGLELKNKVSSLLQSEGFTVDTFADIPANLSQYDLVYLEAYFANEPSDAPALCSYVSNGGGIVFWEGSMCYLVYYSKTMNTGHDLSSIESWFGASYYVNTGGAAHVSVPNPFGTTLNVGDPLVSGQGYSNAGITSMSADSQVAAVWSDGITFAFAHEFGLGRVYWQSTQQNETPSSPQNGNSNKALSLVLHGSFDYGITEQAKVKVFAELKDSSTRARVSGANVTIQIFDPNNTLWVSAKMVEAINGIGIYEWASLYTIADMNLQVGVYLASVAATNGELSASEIILFHVDPPANSTGAGANQWYLATIIALILGGILVIPILVKKVATRRRARPI